MRKTALFLWLNLFLVAFLFAQDGITIKGVVIDDVGNPLPGANITVVGEPLGASTDVDGFYTFTMTPADIGDKTSITLEVSYIGYKPGKATVELSGKEVEQNFELEPDLLNTETIVVTGMGTEIKKEKLGVTIASVPAEEIVRSEESNVVAGLAGKVSNVEITTNSGEPGASAYIRIRGSNTLIGGTQPLFVVDGVPINNRSINPSPHGGVTEMNRASDINPEDIASIDILKGAAAAAIYGSRAANGVILITTKSGKPGKVRATYKITSSSDEVTQLPALQTKYGQGLFGGRFGTISTSWGPKLDTVANVSIYDHAKELFRTGNRIEQNLSLSGGSKTTDYYLSFGRTDHQGFIKGNNDYERSSFRLKATQRIGAQLDVTGNLGYVNTKANRIQKGSNLSGLLLGAFRTPPDFNNEPYIDPVTGLHRSYRYPNPTVLKRTRGYDNPFFIANEQINLTEVSRVYGNVTINYDPMDWLNVRYVLGRDFSNDNRRYVLPPSSSSAPEGTITRSEYGYQETDGNLIIKAAGNFDFADMAVTAYVGHNWNERKSTSFSTTGDNMSVYGFNQLGNTSSYSPGEYESTVRLESFYGQVTFDMWNQLFVTAALRNDGFSTFNAGKNRFWFPKVSTAWEFTKLPFFGESEMVKKWLPYGKLRLAYGETGREAPAYSTISAFGQGAFGSGWGEVLNSTAYGYGGFFTSGTRGNPDLRVERTKELEYGFELGLIENRLSVDFTVYDSESEDVIYPVSLAPSTGFTSQIRNAAVIQNKGIEIGIQARPINMKNFKWDVNLQYGQNDNLVLSLPDVDFVGIGGFSSLAAYAVEGQPLGVFRGEDFVRFGRGIVTNVVDENGNVQQGVNIDEAYSGWKSGDLFVNGDGFPIVDPEIRILGDPNPDWTGSIRNTFTIFKKWRISTLFDIKQGGDIWNGTKGALMFFGTHKDSEDRDGTRVFEGAGPGQGKEVSNLDFYSFVGASGLGNGFTGPSSQFIEDGSYVKLRELSLSYLLDLPEINQWTGLRDIELTLTGRNLFTWTDYTGIDPETNLGANVSWRGFDYFNMPQTRSIIFGLRFNY